MILWEGCEDKYRTKESHQRPYITEEAVAWLLEDRKIHLDLTDAARAWLGRVGYDPAYGARPLKRAVQKYLQDPLADKILSGEIDHLSGLARQTLSDACLTTNPRPVDEADVTAILLAAF